MNRTWTFGRTIAAGFAAVVALNLVVGSIALAGLRNVVDRKDKVINTDARLVLDVQKLLTIRDARAAANRGYLISGDQSYLDDQYHHDDLFNQQLSQIREQVDTDRGRQLADQVASLENQFVLLDRGPVQLRQRGASTQAVASAWEKINTHRVTTENAMNTLFDYQRKLVDTREQKASEAASFDISLIVAVLIASILAAAVLAGVLTRRLRKPVRTTELLAHVAAES
jgi:CHASE3 domain sensor protein